MPVGTSSSATSNGQIHADHFTSSLIGSRESPGCTRYQWPSSIASLITPRNAAPTSNRPADSAYGPPSAPAAPSSATNPNSGANRSSTGGNSGPEPGSSPSSCP